MREDGGSSLTSSEIRAALARVLASPPFRNAEQLRAFLTYVVEEELAGRGDALKGYTIGTDALGRPSDFDPSRDAIVRVEANRIRRALAAYENDPSGRRDPVRIALPAGGYRPVFDRVPEARVQTAGAPMVAPSNLPSGARLPSGRPRSGFSPIVAALLAAALLVVGGLAWVLQRTSPAGPAVTTARPAIATTSPAIAGPVRPISERPSLYVAPTTVRGEAPRGAFTAEGMSLRLQDALARFEGVRVLAAFAVADLRSGSASDFRPDPAVLRERADYMVSSEVLTEGAGEFTVTVRLVRLSDAEIVLTREFGALSPSPRPGATEIDIARSIAFAVAAPSGAIMADARARPSPERVHYQCVARLYDVFRVFDRAVMAEALTCVQQAIRAVPSDPIFHIAGAYLHSFASRFSTTAEEQVALSDQALSMATRALNQAPDSARANHVMLVVQSDRGNTREALGFGERALALNPFDMDIVADFGMRLLIVGANPRGYRLLLDALSVNPAPPDWYSVYAYLGALALGQMSDLPGHAARLSNDAYAPGVMVRLAEAHRVGEHRRVRDLVSVLQRLHPQLSRAPRDEYHRFIPGPPQASDVLARVIQALAEVAP